MRSMWILAIAGILAVGMPRTAFAQERATDNSGLGTRLRTGDRVWVEIDTTDVRTGRVLGVANGMLTLATDGTEESIPVSHIWRVQRKQNGIALGMLVGAGVGFALGLPIAAIGANEGTGVAGPLLFMTGVGAAVGGRVQLGSHPSRTAAHSSRGRRDPDPRRPAGRLLPHGPQSRRQR